MNGITFKGALIKAGPAITITAGLALIAWALHVAMTGPALSGATIAAIILILAGGGLILRVEHVARLNRARQAAHT